jgi:hypothetical protein
MAVARGLDGFMLTGPCGNNTEATVCSTAPAGGGACPNQTGDVALQGVRTKDAMVTLGGTAGTMYNITLHVQGVVESKRYDNGRDVERTLTSPRANGFVVGGTPTTLDFYNVYLVRVTPPGGTATDYFLNGVQPPGVSDHTTYGIDYTATLAAAGGSNIRLVSADRNCSMIKNCGPSNANTAVCATPIVIANVEPTSVALNTNFNFTTPFNGQWIVLTVKNVCLPGSAGCPNPT